MKPLYLLSLLLVLAAGSAVAQRRGGSTPAPAPNPYDTAFYSQLQWRNLGPFRGGRSVAACGVPGQPQTYYMGSTGGGLWKTTDGGLRWANLSDGYFATGSVGAVAVAPSDPNVVYVGMGEHAVRGVMTSHGDGVYKSTDGGKTWAHLSHPELDRTMHISRIQIHPAHPEVVYVAAQGALHGPNPDRGVFKSTDGGSTWQKILYTDQNTGAVELSLDPHNPRILFAAMWEHRRLPWTVNSGGPGCAIYKTTDGGAHWEKLAKGLPDKMGKIAVAVSPANPERVYANIEAEGEKGGVYRSDDGGASWTQTCKDRVTVARAWYYIEIFPDPQDAETVYVLNAPMLKSIDGGRTFTPIPVPHGDTHDLWINPRDPQNLILAHDGGATVSFNGGKSWSSQENQPTSQFYRVLTDNQFPYKVYGGQQDNSSVVTASRTDGPGIGWKDWAASAGCECSTLAIDQEDPEVVYGTCYQGIISVLDTRTGEERSIMAYPQMGLGSEPKNQKYRFNWNAPLLASQHNRKALYHAANVVLKTEDKGLTWREISPDLTRNEKDKQGFGGGPYTAEGAGGEVYNTIYQLVESPHTPGTLWAGTDDGRLHLTQNDGQTWTELKLPNLGEAIIHSIEVSPHAPATAYVCAQRYKVNDFTTYVFCTDDFGKTWKSLSAGLEPMHFAKVLREDPKRKDLLYLGTELGLYVSFNGGANWQPLQLNLPIVPITDLKIKDNDLVAATAGRGFWVLDDLTPLHQLGPQTAQAASFLFRPRDTYKLNGGDGDAPGYGKNPPAGAIIYYYLRAKTDSTLRLDILNAEGKTVRSYSSQKEEAVPNPLRLSPDAPLSTGAGLHRLVWNLRTEHNTLVPSLFVNGSLVGYRVPPGRYTARLTLAGQVQEQPFEVLAHPKVKGSPEQYREQAQLLEQAHQRISDIHRAVNELNTLREFVKSAAKLHKDKQLGTAADELTKKIDEAKTKLVQEKQKTFQDVINFPNQLNADFAHLKEELDNLTPTVTQGAKQRFKDLETIWQQRKAEVDQLLEQDGKRFQKLVQDKAAQ
jgi:photosystem II stability/assembly factor-like uncharacterized protein